MTARPRRFLEMLLLVGGVAGISIWGWSTAREGLYEDWYNWVFDRQQATAKSAASTPGDNVPPSPMPARRAGDPGLLGRLRIPRLNLQAVVGEGTEEKTLSLALGHVAGTALPGQNGNVAVAGHRDSLFRGLRNIRLNDRIVFETGQGDTYEYQVNSTRIVKPTEVSVLNAGLYPELTLITCYPFNYVGSAPERFIVKARQVGQTMRNPGRTEIAQAQAPVPEPLPAATPEPPPPPPAPKPVAQASPRRVPFEVAMNHSRQLAPGISIGLTKADPERKTVDGWMWVMPDRRTIWLRDQSTHQPIVIYGAGGRREVVIDSISRNSMRGYLVL